MINRVTNTKRKIKGIQTGISEVDFYFAFTQESTSKNQPVNLSITLKPKHHKNTNIEINPVPLYLHLICDIFPHSNMSQSDASISEQR